MTYVLSCPLVKVGRCPSERNEANGGNEVIEASRVNEVIESSRVNEAIKANRVTRANEVNKVNEANDGYVRSVHLALSPRSVFRAVVLWSRETVPWTWAAPGLSSVLLGLVSRCEPAES